MFFWNYYKRQAATYFSKCLELSEEIGKLKKELENMLFLKTELNLLKKYLSDRGKLCSLKHIKELNCDVYIVLDQEIIVGQPYYLRVFDFKFEQEICTVTLKNSRIGGNESSQACELEVINVNHEYRDKGIGTLVLHYLSENAWKTEIEYIYGTCDMQIMSEQPNKLPHFYQKSGFTLYNTKFYKVTTNNWTQECDESFKKRTLISLPLG